MAEYCTVIGTHSTVPATDSSVAVSQTLCLSVEHVRLGIVRTCLNYSM